MRKVTGPPLAETASSALLQVYHAGLVSAATQPWISFFRGVS